jgi:glyoxylase-like metal-dependent hydrolase (beta-lactamase superfamily II)
VTAVRLAEQVWLVGTGGPGPAHTNPYDCNQYLVWNGTDGVLIDAGSGIDSRPWLDNVAEVTDFEALHGVLLTHWHGDHAGGAAFAQANGLTVWASPLTSDALSTGDEERTQARRAREAGVYPADYRLQPAPGIGALVPGAAFAPRTLHLSVIDSPGHCDGHLVFGLPGANDDSGPTLFTGDVIFAGGTVSLQAIPDCRIDLYGETVASLARLDAAALFPGHGHDLQDAAAIAADFAFANSHFDRLIPPPNWLV